MLRPHHAELRNCPDEYADLAELRDAFAQAALPSALCWAFESRRPDVARAAAELAYQVADACLKRREAS